MLALANLHEVLRAVELDVHCHLHGLGTLVDCLLYSAALCQGMAFGSPFYNFWLKALRNRKIRKHLEQM